MNEFTKGNPNVILSNRSYGLYRVDIAAKRQRAREVLTADRPLGIAENGEHAANCDLIAQAFSAATKAAEMGFDGIEAVEALPELLGSAAEAQQDLKDIFNATDKGRPYTIEELELGFRAIHKLADALAKARGGA